MVQVQVEVTGEPQHGVPPRAMRGEEEEEDAENTDHDARALLAAASSGDDEKVRHTCTI